MLLNSGLRKRLTILKEEFDSGIIPGKRLLNISIFKLALI